jgi:hypothetical protein
MFVRYENNRLSSQPHAVAGVSGLDSMIGISSYERSVHGNERQKTFLKKKKKEEKKRKRKREKKRVWPLRQGFCDHRTSHRFAISYRLKSKER